MSDWGMYELEDIVWDEFGECDDHIVPQPGGEEVYVCPGQGDYHKKLRHEAVNAVGRSIDDKKLGNSFQGKEEPNFHHVAKDESAPVLDRVSWSDPPESEFAAFYSISCPDKVAGLVPKEATISDNCFKTSNIKSVDIEFCRDDPILENQDAMTGSNLCRFSLVGISSDGNLEFLGTEDEDREGTSLLDYSWSDIGNFDDVDRMFRNCDFTFGQGSTSTSEELLWASREDILNSDFRPSTSETSVFKSKLKQCDANMDFIPCDHLPVLPECDKKAESRRGISSLPTIPTKQLPNQKLPMPMPSSHEVVPPPVIALPKILWEPDSFRYPHNYIPCMPSGCHYPSNQIPVIPAMSSIKSENQSEPANSDKLSHSLIHDRSLSRSQESPSKMPSMTPQEKIEKLRRRQQVRAAFAIGHQQQHFVIQSLFADKHHVQEQSHDIRVEVTIEDEVGGRSGAQSAVEVDSSTAQESSCMSPMLPDELSLEESSFYQLQNVMAQSFDDLKNGMLSFDTALKTQLQHQKMIAEIHEVLDIRTKLCIRDSLYRLARSAEQRHKFSGVSCSSRDGKERNGGLVTEEPYKSDQLQSNRCAESVDMETNTNPIDRSIAHLLFHRPSDSYTVPANDALSLESNIIVSIDKLSAPVNFEFY